MIIEITDDFDPKKIMISGQCFRVREPVPGTFFFITGNHFLYIKKAEDKGTAFFEVSCTEKEWEEIWTPYFDLERSYSDIASKEYGKNDFSDRAIDFGRGLRILKQDKWEMLITFIISQRKSIPAISSAVEALSSRFGKVIPGSGDAKGFADPGTDTEDKYSFPTPEELSKATHDDLKSCGLGYRAPYIRDAIEKVCTGELDLEEMAELPDEQLFERLMEVHGVGKKVANCVLLFGYARTARVPIDVWISRAIDEEFGGENIFPMFGENGGIIQQYIFYYEKNYPKYGAGEDVPKTSKAKRQFPMSCPCCGEGIIDEPHGICSVCGWEDDKLQNADPELKDGANSLSLNEARKKFREGKSD